MSPEAILLAEQYGGIWKEHDLYPLKDWQYTVANDDTRQSYWDWVLIQLDQSNIFPKEEDAIDDPMKEDIAKDFTAEDYLAPFKSKDEF